MSVRRAVLPWRRLVHPSRFDFTPGGGLGRLVDDPLGFFVAVLLFPLWLPAAVMLVPALAELLVELVVLPIALVVRRLRHHWPVQVLDGTRVVRSTAYATFTEAGIGADALRAELLLAVR